MIFNKKSVIDFANSLSDAEIAEINRKDLEAYENEVVDFKNAYALGTCHVCGHSFSEIKKEKPCFHWLLRQGKVKPKELSAVFEKYSYYQISAFLRWCANEEIRHLKINDIVKQKDSRKILLSTIVWKNIEWTFDCSINDYKGHGTGKSEKPHYHFQMRIDNRQFINFGDMHCPLSDNDIFNIELQGEPFFKHSFGSAGRGMNDVMSLAPEDILKHAEPESYDTAQYRMSTIIKFNTKDLPSEKIDEIFFKATSENRTIASVAHELIGSIAHVITNITPSSETPEIAKRTEHKSR